MSKTVRGFVFRRLTVAIVSLLVFWGIISFYRHYRLRADFYDLVDQGILIEGTIKSFELKSSLTPTHDFNFGISKQDPKKSGDLSKDRWIEVQIEYADRDRKSQSFKEEWDSRPEYAKYRAGSKIQLYYCRANAFVKASSRNNPGFQKTWGSGK